MRTPEHLVLSGGDRYGAIAHDRHILFYRFDDLPADGGAARPVAEIRTESPVIGLASRPGERRLALVVALADRSLVELELPEPLLGRDSNVKPRSRVLLKDMGGELRYLVCTRRSTLAVVDRARGAGPVLVAVSAEAGGATRRAELPLANLTSVSALDPQRSDLLVAVDARHGAHVLGFPTGQDSTALEVAQVDAEVRATAVAALSDQWLVIARKGGELLQVRATPATGGRVPTAAEVCRRLRHLLRACGCECREPRPPGGPGTPGNGDPPDGPSPDDEPCQERQRATLGWTVAQLRRAGRYLVALAKGGERMAVLDHNLNVAFERYLGPRGSLVATSPVGSGRMLVMQRGTNTLEAWSLDEYVPALRGVPATAPGRRPADPALARPVTFHGRKSRPASPNPHLRVCVFTVTEPGQVFTDPDQAKMQALLEPNVYDIAYDYYRENSFQTLETEFTVFGVHLGAPHPPLVLPRSFASYFYDDYTPGGIEAVMPADWADPPVFDGTEAMTLHSEPAFGVGTDYAIPFAALWTTHTHNAYPVAVNFAGTETLQLDVEDETGAARVLNLAFGALALNHAQGDDEAAFLDALGQHVTNAIRAAESAAGAPVVIQDVVFRRIRTSDDDTQFGRLQGQIRVAAAGGATQKGRVTLTLPGPAPAALVAAGLDGVGSRSGVLGSPLQIASYFAECLHAAQRDAGEGEGLNDPHLDTAVETEEDAAAQEVRVRINLASDKGGNGARITLLSTSELEGSGWPAAAPVAASDSNVSNQNAMRYHPDLANDVFTAAMEHLRATGPWDAEAVRAQFADFDAMMIGFVGACPASVPAADRWNCTNAVDFGRLRMFVRRHQATDLNNPDPDDPPVTMGTDLLIGQRFNQFDPAVMSHEIGHGLGLPDLYSDSGFRDDVEYIDRWCQMAGYNFRFNHFCAWSKWAVNWIVEDPGNPSLNRVVNVPMPDPAGVTETEAWLCPVEYWDNAMRADIEAEVGAGLPIGQMMKVHLGSDGGVVDLIELRAPGVSYSQMLPPTPAVIVTNVLQPGTDRRWAVNGLYRRSVHLLNEGRELTAVGDTFDFAASPEFPVKGTTVELVDLRTIRGGTIPIARVKVVREAAEFIDLFFQDNVPSWRSPDIWVDWPADNPDPSVARVYPEGTPTDQGETVRFPSSGVEPHFLVVRPHNAGVVHAEDVKVRWFICDPPGAGDDGRWVQRDTMTIPLINGGTWEAAPFTWNVDPATNAHQCLRAEIIDWTIPAGVDPATGDTLALASDDVLLQNNNAQKNVFEFEATT
ncbi:hypothetical protein BO221_09915 [Archangium sp. Cb G35]|uniref:hypothetical protein n=1 Tax=Archangium sp. Cb G35 TaxID=1920190 RepID=UPI0009364A39|nr:hypothetical protein [Archangium sp. Cb G35]OJT26128.1 hypothetical protein BO221_09915 [Archangium sp. Cb G35]